MTRAFVFDQDFNAQYSNGLDDDPLRKIAQSAFDLFNKNLLKIEMIKNINEMVQSMNHSMQIKTN